MEVLYRSWLEEIWWLIIIFIKTMLAFLVRILRVRLAKDLKRTISII